MKKKWSQAEIERQITWFQNLIIFEDSKLVIINKPRGVPVQSGTNIKFSIDDVLHAMEKPLKIVHRLDRETTGVLVFAKHADIAKKICKNFHEQLMYKTYLAIIHGKIEKNYFFIDQPLLEKKIGNEKIMMVNKDGKDARTNVTLLEYNKNINQSLIELKPTTGRKHQLRAHLSFLNHPIVGDTKYNFQEKKKRLMLHAQKIEFSLKERDYSVEAQLPEHWNDFHNQTE